MAKSYSDHWRGGVAADDADHADDGAEEDVEEEEEEAAPGALAAPARRIFPGILPSTAARGEFRCTPVELVSAAMSAVGDPGFLFFCTVSLRLTPIFI